MAHLLGNAVHALLISLRSSRLGRLHGCQLTTKIFHALPELVLLARETIQLPCNVGRVQIRFLLSKFPLLAVQSLLPLGQLA